MAKRSKKATVDSVAAINGDGCRSAISSTEEIDLANGTVTEICSSMAMPSLAIKSEIHNRRYAYTRAYVLERKRHLAIAERNRNTIRPPVPRERRRPKRVVTSTLCPDCDGSGYARHGDCPRCKGECWVLS